MPFTAVVSLSRKPSVQTGRRITTGDSKWGRDPYHIRRNSDPTKTRCGRDCTDWLVMGEKDEPTWDCCVRCQSITDPSKQ